MEIRLYGYRRKIEFDVKLARKKVSLASFTLVRVAICGASLVTADRETISLSAEAAPEDQMTVLWSGLVCVTMFAIGFGFLFPVSGWLGDVADIGGIASGMVFVGLLEGR